MQEDRNDFNVTTEGKGLLSHRSYLQKGYDQSMNVIEMTSYQQWAAFGCYFPKWNVTKVLIVNKVNEG